MRTNCKASSLINNEKIRVTRFDFAPNEETGWHEHEFDYVITILTDCKMLLENPDGSNTSAEFIAGDVYERKQGVRHNVINASDQPMSFIELELKK